MARARLEAQPARLSRLVEARPTHLQGCSLQAQLLRLTDSTRGEVAGSRDGDVSAEAVRVAEAALANMAPRIEAVRMAAEAQLSSPRHAQSRSRHALPGHARPATARDPHTRPGTSATLSSHLLQAAMEQAAMQAGEAEAAKERAEEAAATAEASHRAAAAEASRLELGKDWATREPRLGEEYEAATARANYLMSGAAADRLAGGASLKTAQVEVERDVDRQAAAARAERSALADAAIRAREEARAARVAWQAAARAADAVLPRRDGVPKPHRTQQVAGADYGARRLEREPLSWEVPLTERPHRPLPDSLSERLSEPRRRTTSPEVEYAASQAIATARDAARQARAPRETPQLGVRCGGGWQSHNLLDAAPQTIESSVAWPPKQRSSKRRSSHSREYRRSQAALSNRPPWR